MEEWLNLPPESGLEETRMEEASPGGGEPTPPSPGCFGHSPATASTTTSAYTHTHTHNL